jgi:hypothetical protein
MPFVSSEGFARVEVQLPADVDPFSEEAATLWAEYTCNLAVGGIKDCFHNLIIPKLLSRYFALPPVPAHVVHLTGCVVEGVTLKSDSLVWPVPRALPMGFSWSPFFCQDMADNVSMRADCSQTCPLITDSGPPV